MHRLSDCHTIHLLECLSCFLDTISSRSHLVIFAWRRGDGSQVLVAGGERYKQCAVGIERWVPTGQCGPGKAFIEVFFVMNLEEVSGS